MRLGIFVSWFSLLPPYRNSFEASVTKRTDTGVVAATNASKTKVITNRNYLWLKKDTHVFYMWQ